MADPFDYFVIFAEMRTGSNFLEVNLNSLEQLTCYGEAFNPHFIGYPKKPDILGVTQAKRDDDPAGLIRAIKAQTVGLGGFRFFHDHDARILDICLPDPRCAKVILTRNPVESYVSWKIAQTTGQWMLTDVKRRKDGKAKFDAGEFSEVTGKHQAFRHRVLKALQSHGQTAFFLTYKDIQDIDVMNGLARFLGRKDRFGSLDKSLKKQNPGSLSEKVSNFSEMKTALAGLDSFDLMQTPGFEPRRGPLVPSYIAAAKAPLMYLPLQGGPVSVVQDWMAALDNVNVDALRTGMNQKNLRHWKRKHQGHRSFTVLRHPVARAYSAFCDRILSTADGRYARIRNTLKKRYDIPLPAGETDPDYDLAVHQQAFEAFLEFLQINLAGQTAIRVDPAWGTQAQAMQGFGDFCLPDFVFREAELTVQLPELAARLGYAQAPVPGVASGKAPFALSEVYNASIEAKVSGIYQRDYMMFGFSNWAQDQAA